MGVTIDAGEHRIHPVTQHTWIKALKHPGARPDVRNIMGFVETEEMLASLVCCGKLRLMIDTTRVASDFAGEPNEQVEL